MGGGMAQLFGGLSQGMALAQKEQEEQDLKNLMVKKAKIELELLSKKEGALQSMAGAVGDVDPMIGAMMLTGMIKSPEDLMVASFLRGRRGQPQHGSGTLLPAGVSPSHSATPSVTFTRDLTGISPLGPENVQYSADQGGFYAQQPQHGSGTLLQAGVSPSNSATAPGIPPEFAAASTRAGTSPEEQAARDFMYKKFGIGDLDVGMRNSEKFVMNGQLYAAPISREGRLMIERAYPVADRIQYQEVQNPLGGPPLAIPLHQYGGPATNLAPLPRPQDYSFQRGTNPAGGEFGVQVPKYPGPTLGPTPNGLINVTLDPQSPTYAQDRKNLIRILQQEGGSPPAGPTLPPGAIPLKPGERGTIIPREKVPNWINRQTGQALPAALTAKTPAELEAAGYRQLTDDERRSISTIDQSFSIINMIEQKMADVFGTREQAKSVSPLYDRTLGALTRKGLASSQLSPSAAAFEGFLDTSLSKIARSFGETGALAEGDIARAKAARPSLTDTGATAWEKIDNLRMFFNQIKDAQINGVYDSKIGVAGAEMQAAGYHWQGPGTYTIKGQPMSFTNVFSFLRTVRGGQ